VRGIFQETMSRLDFTGIELVMRDPRTVIASADAVMCASGTATLETLLVNRPMVVAYRISPSTYQFLKYSRLLRMQDFSLPNILAGETLVPELIQHEAVSGRLSSEINRWLDDEQARNDLRQRFLELHARLRCAASARAAQAVGGLLES
jgi:lipid-A-disaccharide synthase